MSDLYQPDKLHQLQLLREQTRLTGGLHEAQVLNLKMWPLVLFQEATSSEFTWDPDKKIVSFRVKLKKAAKIGKAKSAEYKQRVEVLNGWVGQLLGAPWYISVKFDCNTPMTLYGKRNLDVGRNSGAEPGSDSGSKKRTPDRA